MPAWIHRVRVLRHHNGVLVVNKYERWIDTRRSTHSKNEQEVQKLVKRRGGVAGPHEFVEVLQLIGFDRQQAGRICANVERNSMSA